MKNHRQHFQLLLLLLIPLAISCVPEDDHGPDTGDPRDKFIGSWLFNETPAARNIDATFTVTISTDAGNSSQVMLRNFAQAGGMYSAYGIVTSNRITIPNQEMADGFFVEGSGTMSTTSSMDWEYTITAGGDMESFTATASK